MSDRRYLNPAQPQTMQIAVFLLYAEAVFALFGLLSTRQIRVVVFLVARVIYDLTSISSLNISILLVAAAYVIGAYGIANERKWGYILGTGMAAIPFVLAIIYYKIDFLSIFDPFGLLFSIALLVLLIHPQSREYQRIWFK